jgi:hypothetical protein
MGAVPQDYVLRDFQRAAPVLWVSAPRKLPQLPDVSDSAMRQIFDDSRARSIKSWAHDERGVHWLVTRSGLPLHDDIGYTRYTHQLIMRNDGWRIGGQDLQMDLPPLITGVLVCLDTWSPHRVFRDERFRNSKKALYKAMLVVDRDEPLDEEAAWELLSSRLSDPSCAIGLEELRSRTRAPGFDPAKVAATRAALLG